MSHSDKDDEFVEVREQDRWLPIANVDRAMRNALPKNSKISKETKECMQECVSEFISFITSQAAEKCSIEKRKTLNGEDILYALHSLGFENYAEVLRIYLAKYRIFELDEVEKRRKKYLARKQKLQIQKQKQESQPLTTDSQAHLNTFGIEGKPSLQDASNPMEDSEFLNNASHTFDDQYRNPEGYWSIHPSDSSTNASIIDEKNDLLDQFMENPN